MALAIACMACLLYFIHHIAESIQAGHIVDRIARETERTLDQVFPRALDDVPPGLEPEPIPPGTPVLVVRLRLHPGRRRGGPAGDGPGARRRPCASTAPSGSSSRRGRRSSTSRPPGTSTAALEAACRRAFDIGPVRTMEQDVEFGVLQIVDIALKAISPAVNDPTTATTCVDQLGRILLRASLRSPPDPVLRDPDGRARVVLRADLLPPPARRRVQPDPPLRQGRRGRAPADDARPGRAGRRVADTPPTAAAILDQARRLAAACERGFPDDDRAELDERLAAVERSAAASMASDPRPDH